MARYALATVAGALIYYVWGMLAWTVLPIHGPTVQAFPNEQEVIESFRGQNLESGVYIAPFDDGSSAPDSAFNKNHNAGPILTVYLRKEGAQPMAPSMLLGGLVIALLAAAVAVCLLSSLGSCGNSYWCRVGFVAGLGLFVAIVGHLSYWNWMYYPLGYTVAFVIDVLVGWTLAGLAIAALVKPSSAGTVSEPIEIAKTPAAEVQPKPAPTPKPAEPKKPVRNDAVSLLATLQREARFVDIVKEPLGEYSDAQVGAAARDVLRDCGAVLDRLFKIEPILNEEDGATVEIPSDAAKIRLTGNASEEAKSGELVHHGWEVKQCELPSWTGSKELAQVVAQAEVEIK